MNIGAAIAKDFLKRTFFHPGTTKCEEQNVKQGKITVIYSYCLFLKHFSFFLLEERCEPSFPLYRNTGTNRFCPDINNWDEFNQYEIGDGHSGSVQPNRNQYNTIIKEGD